MIRFFDEGFALEDVRLPIAALDLSGRHQASFAWYHATVSASPSSNRCCGA